MPPKESLIICSEQILQIPSMDRGEIRLPNVARLCENLLVYPLDPFANQFVIKLEG